MKKILLALVALGVCSVANAATTSTPLTLTGTLASSCAASFNTSSLNVVFTPGTTTATQDATYTLACTAGSQIATFTATSANAWNFKGATLNDLIPYSVPATATPNYATVVTLWSANPGVTTPVALIPAAITITPAADPIITTLTITPGVTPVATNVDTYADTITIATSYS